MSAPTDSAPPRVLPTLTLAELGVGLLFFCGGCAALTYEVVWFQLLRLTVGASSVSLAITLVAFMGGLCLGAFLAPRLMRQGHPLKMIASLEFGIAAFAVVMPWVVPWLGEFYTRLTDVGTTRDLVARGVVCGLVLLPPTVLMGATLPVMARWMGSSRRGVSVLSWLYAANTLGAMTGTLLTGFIWLRLYSLWGATAVGVALNLAAAIFAWQLAKKLPRQAPSESHQLEPDTPGALTPDGSTKRPSRSVVLVVIGLSGMTALGAQVLWTRLLALLLAVTVYTFAIILAVFLMGLALGTAIGGAIAKRTPRPCFVLGVLQLVLVLAIAWAYWAIERIVPGMQQVISWGPFGVWAVYASDLTRCAYAILPATMLWGASFPVAIAAAGWGEGNKDRLVASIYTANTLGAILGASVFTYFGFGVWGSDLSAKIVCGVAACSGVLMIAVSAGREPMGKPNESPEPKLTAKMSLWQLCLVLWAWCRASLNALQRVTGRLPGAVVVGLLILAFAVTVPGVPEKILIFGRYEPQIKTGDFGIHQVAEGVVSPVGVAEIPTGEKMLYVSGKVVATTIQTDMRLQGMLTHVAALTHPEPRSVLIVGLGTGVTAGSFVLYPEIERIVICEIEPQVAEISKQHFAQANHRVLEDPRTEIIFDDARHFLAVTDEKFDIITSDPIHPWVKGASAMYSSEYYELARERLNPGGVITQWVPFYETSQDAARSMLATFFDAFPEGSIWHAGAPRQGQDVVMLAHPDEPRLDLDAWKVKLDSHPQVGEHLAEIGVRDYTELLTRFSAHSADLTGWLSDASINHDASMRLEYLAGMGLLQNVRTRIYRDLIRRRTWPPANFEVSRETREAVQAEMLHIGSQ